MTTLYMWDYVTPVTPNWHPGGGVAIASTTLDAARKAWAKDCEGSFEEEEGAYDPSLASAQSALNREPDRILKLADEIEEFVVVYPDSGCC